MQDALKHYIEDEITNHNAFVKTLDLKLEGVEPGQVILSVTVADKHTNVYGKGHGGLLMTIADTAMGSSCLTQGKTVVTLDLNINFIRGVEVGDHLHTVSRIIHNGARTIVSECDVVRQDGKLMASAKATFFVTGTVVLPD